MQAGEINTNASITNSGTVVATGANSFAIDLMQGANTLTLLQGSLIQGRIGMGSGADTVNLDRGENWLVTFDAADGAPEVLNTFGAAVAVLNGGLTVATFDPASGVAAAEDDAFADLTGAINDGLHYRLTAGNPTTYVWTQGFGVSRSNDESHGAAGGGMMGISTPFSSWARGGVFAGGAEGEIEGRSQDVTQESWFGGAYARAFSGTGPVKYFADVIVTAGGVDSDSVRQIVSNASATGLATAEGSYGGWFVNPELTLGAEMPAMGVTFVPSGSVGYSGLFLDDFSETGSIAAVSIADRDVEMVDGRLQLEIRNTWHDAFGAWRTAVRGGVKGRVNTGDDTLTGVLAQTTAFTVSLDDDESTGAAFAGADVTFKPAPNVQLYVGLDGALESDGGHVLAGRGGGAIKF